MNEGLVQMAQRGFLNLPGSSVKIREYRAEDLAACMEIYRSNIEEFLPDTLDLFESHLIRPFSYYLVVESGAEIMACGGLEISGEQSYASFAFGMVRQDLHGRGLGTLLSLTRLALVDGEWDPTRVSMQTTLKTEPFYQRFGFERKSYPERRYAGGSYYVNMDLQLTMQERDFIREKLCQSSVTFDLEFLNYQTPAPTS